MDDEEGGMVMVPADTFDMLVDDANMCQAFYYAGIEAWEKYELAVEIFEDMQQPSSELLQ